MNGAVLYIDDNQDNTLIIARLFRRTRLDLQLHTASNGAEGIQAAARHRPDLILFDNRLPGTSREHVRRQPGPRRDPRHHLQRRQRPGDRRRTPRRGRRRVLANPFGINQLLALIERYLP
jgi:two-component system cell cycle response regulator DivK